MKFKTISILFLLMFIAELGFGQCAMCRVTVSSNLSEGRGVIGTGLNFGILYLLLTPYLLMGLGVFFYLRSGKKSLAERLKLADRMKQIYRN